MGVPERSPAPTSPSQRFALGPSLSPEGLKGGEGKCMPGKATLLRLSLMTHPGEVDDRSDP